jgi:hypothetical protein
MNTDNYQFSIEQLALNQGSWPEIAEKCEVSYSWLCKFANNEIPNASYKRVERLAKHLRTMRRKKPHAVAPSGPAASTD